MTALTECVPEYLAPAGSVLPPAEIINAAVTSVAVCLDEAGAAFTAQQIDQVCSHLEQASALLDAAIMALTAQAAHEAQHVKLAPAESPVVERPRAMAMSA